MNNGTIFHALFKVHYSIASLKWPQVVIYRRWLISHSYTWALSLREKQADLFQRIWKKQLIFLMFHTI